MGARGGGDRNWLRQIDPHAGLDDQKAGTKVGHHEYRNVRNRQPGRFYRWESKAKNGQEIHARIREGWRVVREDEPERLGDSTHPDFAAAGMNSTFENHDSVLMSIDSDGMEQLKKLKIERAERALQAADHTFLDKGSALTRQYGSPVDREIYERRQGHKLTSE